MALIQGEYLPARVEDSKGKLLEIVYRPHVWFMLKKDHKFTKPIAGLIDSGADRNLFPAGIAIFLGYRVEDGKEYTTFGIGKQSITVYRHKGIDLYFDSGVHFQTEVDFSYQMEANTILFGGIGFFDKFKNVSFSKNDQVVELEY